MVPQVGYTWGWDWCNPPVPMTIIPSNIRWDNYKAGMDVFIESGEVYLGVRKGSTQEYCGYAIVIDKTGNWRLCYDDVTLSSNILECGTIWPFDGNTWHLQPLGNSMVKVKLFAVTPMFFSRGT